MLNHLFDVFKASFQAINAHEKKGDQVRDVKPH